MIGKIISQYKILEELGRGGMGVVYKAHDSRLKRDVAIKFLPDNVSASEEKRERFRIEAQAAAALNHPNIATIFAIEEHEGTLFLSMELIEGQELKDIVERHPLPIEQVIEIATQIADGLRAAHARGIIHRDIKTRNIMLTNDGMVKIMDFGLAKVGDDPGLTGEHATMGTAAYMSPEQIQGAQIDHRTDIWAFGVVLYEIVCGKLPFQGEYNQALFYAILQENFQPVPASDDHMMTALQGIISRCLEKIPQDRYQSMDEVIKDLQAVESEAFSSHPEPALPHGTVELNRDKSAKKFIRRLLPWAAMLVLLISVGHWLWLSFGSGHAVPDSPHLLVLPIQNVSGQADQQPFCDGLMETLTSKLTQMERFNKSLWVVPSSEVYRSNIQSAGEAKEAFGVNLVISGSLQMLEEEARLTLNLIDAQGLRQIGSRMIDLPVKRMGDLQQLATTALVQMLNLDTELNVEDVLLAGESANPRANEYYLQGKGYLRRYDDLENMNIAIGFFQKAIQADSQFVLAYAALGESFWRRYENQHNRLDADQAVVAGMKAFELDSQLASVNVTLGLIHRGMGEPQKAVGYFNRALLVEPANSEALRGLARSYQDVDRLEEAEQVYKRAIRLKPDYWAAYNELGVFYYRQGKYRQAVEQFQQVTQLTPDNYKIYSNMGGIYYMLEEWDNAERMLKKSLQLKATSSAATNLGTLYFIQGRYPDAARQYELALKLNDRNHNQWGNLAAAYYWLPGRREESLKLYRQAIQLAETEKAVTQRDVRLISRLGGYYATVGDTSHALENIEKSLELGPRNVNVMYNAGTSYEILGYRDEALHWIGKALAQGYPRSDVERQPEMQKFVNDPRYRKMVEQIFSAKTTQ